MRIGNKKIKHRYLWTSGKIGLYSICLSVHCKHISQTEFVIAANSHRTLSVDVHKGM